MYISSLSSNVAFCLKLKTQNKVINLKTQNLLKLIKLKTQGRRALTLPGELTLAPQAELVFSYSVSI